MAVLSINFLHLCFWMSSSVSSLVTLKAPVVSKLLPFRSSYKIPLLRSNGAANHLATCTALIRCFRGGRAASTTNCCTPPRMQRRKQPSPASWKADGKAPAWTAGHYLDRSKQNVSPWRRRIGLKVWHSSTVSKRQCLPLKAAKSSAKSSCSDLLEAVVQRSSRGAIDPF